MPAAALITMCPGKASPFVFGGKIHTPQDTPDRVYPEPLRQTLEILDYFFHILEGGTRPQEPRQPNDCHYARLYAGGGKAYLALKDAVEPNRRNLNMIYGMDVTFAASPTFAIQFFHFFWATIPLTVALEFGLITYLFVVAIPTWIDNSYRHLNKADNLLSRKRARKGRDNPSCACPEPAERDREGAVPRAVTSDE